MSFLSLVGAACCLSVLSHLVSLIWLYSKPSRLHRYLHTTDGKPAWALITGATGGIGGQLAAQLAALGFNVVLHGRTQAKLETLRDDLSGKYPNRSFRILVLDAGEPFGAGGDDWVASLQDINLTVLINNAGGTDERVTDTLENMSSMRLIKDASVNALFPTLLLRGLIPILCRNTPGLIINIGSLADIGITLGGSYPASKTYLMKLTETVGREMRQTHRDVEVLGIRVGNVYGTAQSVQETRDIFSLDAAPMAQAILARVGCGRHMVVGHWLHAFQFELLQLLPGFIYEPLLISLTSGWNTSKGKKAN